MKVFLSLILILVFGMSNARASHLAGGHMSYECIDVNTYAIQLTIFRDCASDVEISPEALGPVLFLESVSCDYPCTEIANMTYVEHEEIDYGCGYNCETGGYPGFEQFKFQAIITLPDNCSDWKVSTLITARNTTDYAGGGNYINYVLINNEDGICNNSPKFNDLGVWLGCVNTLTSFENSYTEDDGDDLIFEIVSPLVSDIGEDCNHTNINYLTGGLSATNPTPSLSGITINPVTGELTMTPTASGTSYFAVKVSEYRGGVLVSETIRDGETIVQACLPASIGFSDWYESGESTLTVDPRSQDCYQIGITGSAPITDVFLTGVPLDKFDYTVEGLGTTEAILNICPLWDEFEDFCDTYSFTPKVFASLEFTGCFASNGSKNKEFTLNFNEQTYCPEYRYFTNRGAYPLMPLPSVSKASEGIYIGDLMPPASTIDPSEMGPVKATGDHYFEAPVITISCDGGGDGCVDFTVDGSDGVITFVYNDPLCGPDCPPVPLAIEVTKVFKCRNERLEVSVTGGEPPYTYTWSDHDGNIFSSDSVAMVNELVEDSTWNQKIPYTLYIEDLAGNNVTHTDSLNGTKRFYEPITNSIFMYTHADGWTMYEDSTHLYAYNHEISFAEVFVINDDYNTEPPWYGATKMDLWFVDRYGTVRREQHIDLETELNDWSIDNNELYWDGTPDNNGEGIDCMSDAEYIAWGNYRLEATNCETEVHEEIDIIHFISCFTGDFSDSIIVAMTSESGGGGRTNYSGIEFVHNGNTSSISGMESGEINILMYPNPADNVVNIKGVNIEVELIRIVDLQGREVLQVENTKTVDISPLSNGTYDIIFFTSAGIMNKKLIVK